MQIRIYKRSQEIAQITVEDDLEPQNIIELIDLIMNKRSWDRFDILA